MIINKTSILVDSRSKFRNLDNINRALILEFIEFDSGKTQGCVLCSKKLRVNNIPVCKACVRDSFLICEGYPGLDISMSANIDPENRCHQTILTNQMKLKAINFVKYLKIREREIEIGILVEQYNNLKRIYKEILDSEDWGDIFLIKENMTMIIERIRTI